jgi:hypothetical protein
MKMAVIVVERPAMGRSRNMEVDEDFEFRPSLVRASETAMSYTVPNMTLVTQDMNNACWFASLRMVLQWQNRFRDPFQADNPAYYPDLVAMHQRNNGMPWVQIVPIASQLRLVGISNLATSPTPQVVEQWLRSFGPLYVDGIPVDGTGRMNGLGHAVVLSGVRTSARASFQVHDPWPTPPQIRWQPWQHLTLMLLRNLGLPAQTPSILHLPQEPTAAGHG